MLSGPRLLHKDHRVSQFDSGEPSLDDWLRRRALKNNRSGASRTFVICEEQTVVGYYCLSAAAVGMAIAPEFLRTGMPDPIPALLIGRLAIDKKYQGQKLGDFLVRDAFLKALASAEILGIAVILVHALHDRAREFWLSYGFTQSPLQEFTLMLPMATLKACLYSNSHKRRWSEEDSIVAV